MTSYKNTLPLSLILSLLGCEQQDTLTSSPSPEGVTCVGASPEVVAMDPPHARLFRGEVKAPPAKTNAGASILDGVFWGRAEAFAIEGEEPVEGAVVTLRAPGSQGDKPRATTTDAQGRYCLLAPARWSPEGGWMLSASWGDGLIARQRAVFPYDGDINATSEALVRVLEDEGVALTSLAPPVWLNMRTMADSAVGLMHPVAYEGEDFVAFVGKVKEALIKDERLLGAIRKKK